MASPQAEDGHTRIANELLEAIYKHDFKATHLRVILWLLRQTYGWARKFHGATMREIKEETNIPTASVGWALLALIEAKVIIKDASGKYGINKDYETWVLSNPLDKQSCPTHWTKASNPLDTSYPYEKESKERAKMSNPLDNSKTIPPKLEWVQEYVKAEGFRFEPGAFFDHHEARGWKLKGGQAMRNWRAAARTWERNSGLFSQPQKHQDDFKPTYIPPEMRLDP